jgi:hypothetical protein
MIKTSKEGRFALEYVAVRQIVLEPGDATRYKLLYSQTEWQREHREVTVSLVDMRGHGASFTVTCWDLERWWIECEDEEATFEKMNAFHLTGYIGGKLGDLKNFWTIRAICQGWDIVHEAIASDFISMDRLIADLTEEKKHDQN